MRAFVAIEVEADAAGGRTRSAPDHLTLHFLGELRPEAITAVAERLRPIGRTIAPFDLRLEGVGAFPTADRPRVVWIGATSGRENVERLARAVRGAVEVGTPVVSGAFVPHLTWFRVRSPDDLRRALDALAHRIPPPATRSVRVTEFVLKESVLGPGGAVHRTIETYPLSGVH